ncbi:hypothetical protein F4805DRAFT_459385 [Annulohypoxylon moriforme]|nr:hypothetical protein F4805DRAFT_459385 [Annulohypoxylon moriforme]
MSYPSDQQTRGPSWTWTIYPDEAPEFCIYDNHPKNLAGYNEFTVTVKRRSAAAEADYVKIYLLEWDAESAHGGFVSCDQEKFTGTKKKRWDSRRSITFDDLELTEPGLYRLEVEIYRYRGGSRHDVLLERLISNDIEKPESSLQEGLAGPAGR